MWPAGNHLDYIDVMFVISVWLLMNNKKVVSICQLRCPYMLLKHSMFWSVEYWDLMFKSR